MHTVLRIAEITSVVFRLLDQGDLARCSRVCLAWFTPVIDVLWETVEFKTELIGLLKNVGLLHQADKKSEWECSGGVSQRDWDRIYLYTSKIRRLNLKGRKLISLTPKAREFLATAQHTSGGPLLPRARQFSFFPRNNSDACLGIVFLPHLPQLTSLDITIPNYFAKQDLDILWSSLQPNCPYLTDLEISTLHASPVLQDEIWSSLCSILPSCTKLVTLNVISLNTHISEAAFNILGSLPVLKKIGSSPYHMIRQNATHPLDTSKPFSELEALVMPYNESLQDFWFPPRKLQLLSMNELDANMAFSLISRLASYSTPLRNIGLDVTNALAYSHLSELANLHQIRFLTLAYFDEISISDDNLKQLAAGLPELELFHLIQRNDVGSPLTSNQLTLLAIGHLVSHCPNIQSIAMKFDACVLPSSQTYPSLLPTVPPSLSLCISPGASAISNPAGVAHWLMHVCRRYAEVRIELVANVPVRSVVHREHWKSVKMIMLRQLHVSQFDPALLPLSF